MPKATPSKLLQIYLRNLYFTRTVVQLLWAGIVIGEAVGNPLLAAGLLIVYPLWDVVCTLYDVRVSARVASAPPTAHYLNMVLGILAAIGIALTVFHSPQYVVVTFGIWAFAAGLAQFAVGISRRKIMGGQWAMILSGIQSTAAGVFFTMGGLDGTKHIQDLGRYAILGGIYFLIAGFLLQRKLSRMEKGDTATHHSGD